jgi:hypothetical protein
MPRVVKNLKVRVWSLHFSVISTLVSAQCENPTQLPKLTIISVLVTNQLRRGFFFVHMAYGARERE